MQPRLVREPFHRDGWVYEAKVDGFNTSAGLPANSPYPLEDRSMRAFVIAQENSHDEAMVGEYRQKVVDSIASFGGKFVVRGGTLTVLEGDWPYERTVIVEFSSRAMAEAWYQSPAYQKVLPLRLNSTSSNVIIVDGVD